jgi:hypothetical protein
LLPETKGLTLEELDNVFGVKNREHVGYYLRKFPWYINKYFLRRDVEPFPPLYAFAEEKLDSGEKPQAHHNEAPLTSSDSDKVVGA